MNKHIFLSILLLPLLSVAQSSSSLRIGDTVPAAAFTGLTKQAGTLLNSKLLILDFWSTSCTSCLQGFPKLEALQQQFSDRLQVVLINARATGDNVKRIDAFFARRKNSKGIPYSFASITEDTIFSSLFTHRTIPHYVWIDHNRIVRAITGPEEVIGENIAAFISGSYSTLRLKNDLEVDLEAPLFVNNNGGIGANLLHRSILTGFTPGIHSFAGKSSTPDGMIRLYTVNSSVEALYNLANPFLFSIPPNRVILQANKPEQYQVTGDVDTWKYKHAYTYELLAPLADSSRLQHFMQQDLDRYFGLELKKEIRDIPCYVLTKKTAANYLQPKTKNKLSAAAEKYMTISSLARSIDRLMPVPFLNETGLSDYQVMAPASFSEISQIKQTLERQDFTISFTCRLLEVYTLTEKNYNPANNQQ